jgi:hypothetical protein
VRAYKAHATAEGEIMKFDYDMPAELFMTKRKGRPGLVGKPKCQAERQLVAAA